MENPLSCPVANCSMVFDTEEQLSAHKKKHELSLTLTPSVYKNPFILDQTPTPTQFLSPLSLELHDFHSDNPFDVTFRRANSSNHASSNFLIPESSSLIASLPDSEVLNTPSIILTSEPATPISLKPNFSKKLTLKSSNNHCTENTDSLPFSPVEQTVQSSAPVESLEDAELPSESASFANVPSDFDLLPDNTESGKKSILSKNVLQTSVITSVGNTAILKSSTIGVPTAVVVTRAPVNSISTLSTSQVSIAAQQTNQVKVQKSVPSVVQPLCMGTVLLSFNLVDGQQIFQLPVVPNNPPSTVTPIAPQVTSTTMTTTTAKMKLKQVLTQNQKSVASVKKEISATKAKAKSSDQMLSDSQEFDELSSPPLSPMSSPKPGHNGRKRRENVDDSDDKRMRSLERNRAAATRCRRKKKIWITSLEKKAVELGRTNLQLQTEVSLLRNEVAHLKTLLLAHKDCPVTLQQKAETETYTTVRIITTAPSDLQQVSSISEISPSNSDFMEMEVNSVQSSDSSQTSDISETSSYRER